MSTDTDTTADTLGLSTGTLTLVTIAADYFRNDGRAWSDGPTLTEADDDGRTFYAAPSPDPAQVLVVEPRTSDRAIGMWSLGRDEAGVRLEDDHGGWNVPRSVVTPYGGTLETSDPHRPPSADLDESQRRGLPIAEAYPVGTRWEHAPSGVTYTVTGHRGSTVLGTRDDGTSSAGWDRYALDVHGVYVGREGGPQEATTGPQGADETPGGTFTQADVDRLVREARDEERRAQQAILEEFKETANARAVEYAESNGLCSEFERCMADIGLMGREEWREAHQRTYRVTVEVVVDQDADNEDDARDRARDRVYNELPGDLDDDVTAVAAYERG